TPIPTEEQVAAAPESTAPPEEPEPAAEGEGEDAPPPEETEEEADPEGGGDNQIEEIDDEDPEGFNPDYQIDAGGPVTLRPGPGVNTGDAIIALPNATPLMYMDEQQETQDPERDLMESGQVWMLFQAEDG